MAELLPLVIDQGEDWTTQLVWTDMFDEPLPVIHPCRMAIKTLTGQTIAELETNPAMPEGEIPSIVLSTETGIVQMHLSSEQTSAFNPGAAYHYDLFVTLDNTDSYPGDQLTRLVYGPVTINKRVTLF